MGTPTIATLLKRVEEMEQVLDQFTEDRISYALQENVPSDTALFIEKSIKHELAALRSYLRVMRDLKHEKVPNDDVELQSSEGTRDETS